MNELVCLSSMLNFARRYDEKTGISMAMHGSHQKKPPVTSSRMRKAMNPGVELLAHRRLHMQQTGGHAVEKVENSSQNNKHCGGDKVA